MKDQGPMLTPKQHKDLQWLKRKEDKPRYFVNGWLAFSMSILAVCIVAPIAMGDAVTWITWGACVALVLGGRAYQFFIQGK